MSFLDRLFRIQEREAQIREAAAVLAQAHLDVAESYAQLAAEWERLNTCAKRIDEILNSAKDESIASAREFTEADKIAARGLGVQI